MKFLAFILALVTNIAEAGCRQALALAVDVSGSVDRFEHALQRDGLANALRHPDVQAAFLADPANPVRLMVFEWAGSASQFRVVPWMDIVTPDDLEHAAHLLGRVQRRWGGLATATGNAMTYGAQALRAQKDCERWTLDVSTDGLTNAGPRPEVVRDALGVDGITINGLAIGSGRPDGSVDDTASLQRIVGHLHARVIRGPGAFVEVTASFQGFAEAIRRKLVRELAVQVIGEVNGRTNDNG